MDAESTNTSHPFKKEDLETHLMGDQVMIYQPGSDVVHSLNPTAAVVLEFCDGTHSETEIAELVQEAYELSDVPVAEVRDCLERLRASGLLRS